MDIKWQDGFKIKACYHNDEITLSANREGLLSLAEQLIALANESPGSHIHYDEHNSLEDNSVPLIIERID